MVFDYYILCLDGNLYQVVKIVKLVKNHEIYKDLEFQEKKLQAK